MLPTCRLLLLLPRTARSRAALLPRLALPPPHLLPRAYTSSSQTPAPPAPPSLSPSAPPAAPQPRTAPLPEHLYHRHADALLAALRAALEDLQDARGELDVDFSAGVLTVEHVASRGTYVLNKQPPNRQVWLSSPVSGPRRFDYVVGGEWVCLRDGVKIGDVLREELGVVFEVKE
ncbi:MAG: Mitochondrial chaperone Frataxin [Trizodia sp. TS-e1964]|nr:MAG: Mitochondrial chaperone Frataxin [Trizodia sp. TS-e1964]